MKKFLKIILVPAFMIFFAFTCYGKNTDDLYEQKIAFFDCYEQKYGDSIIYDAIVEIHNISDQTLFLKECTFEIEDGDGNYLASEEGHIYKFRKTILPGESGYFYNWGHSEIYQQSEDGTYNLKVTPSVGTTSNIPDDYEIGFSDIKDFTLVGTLTNNTDVDDTTDFLEVAFFDAEDNIIGICGNNIYDIPYGKPMTFEIWLTDATRPVKDGEYVRYEIDTQAYDV